MVGDSVTRYQYIELAFYVTYGLCPEERKRRGFKTPILQTAAFAEGWPAFYKKSSQVLNAVSPQRQTHETCACVKLYHTDGTATSEEIRNFFYTDAQVGHLMLLACTWLAGSSRCPLVTGIACACHALTHMQ